MTDQKRSTAAFWMALAALVLVLLPYRKSVVRFIRYQQQDVRDPIAVVNKFHRYLELGNSREALDYLSVWLEPEEIDWIKPDVLDAAETCRTWNCEVRQNDFYADQYFLIVPPDDLFVFDFGLDRDGRYVLRKVDISPY